MKMFMAAMLLAAFHIPAMASGSPRQKIPLDVGGRRQLFVDRWLIESMARTSLKMHCPVPREVVFRFDAPWEGPESGYVTVMKDEGGYRLYYRGGGETTQEVSCMAESTDGIHWNRINPGLFEFNGSRNNNIIYRGQRKSYWESHNFTPFRDNNPAVLSDQKYKAIGIGRNVLPSGEDVKALVGLVSPDGVHWRLLQDKPIITMGKFDSQNVAFWDTNRGEYVCYLRDSRLLNPGTRETVRSVKRATSKDFVHWTAPVWLDFGTRPLEQFYTNAIVQYFHEPSLYLGFPMRFVPERKIIGANSRAVDGVSDGVMLSSHDGLRWDRTFMEAFIRPGLSPGNWGNAHGNNTPAWGVVPTGINEISVYWTENYGAIPQLRRGTLRLDGFASVNAPWDGGEFITHPFRFEGRHLVLNFSTSAVGSIKVEIQDASGKPVPGYSLADCMEIYGDETARVVFWKAGSGLATLAGRSVKMRFVMKDADLYSLRFER